MTSLNKICMHWTAGSNEPCNVDLLAYHFLVNSKGQIFEGIYKPEDNLNCYDGKYAKHCGGGNTGCIGTSLCGMAGFDLKNKYTKYPLTQKQVESFCCLNAYLSIKYGIPITENKVFTHYEFDKKRTKPEKKIDITYINYLPNLSQSSVAKYLRDKINYYKDGIKKGIYKKETHDKYFVFINVA